MVVVHTRPNTLFKLMFLLTLVIKQLQYTCLCLSMVHSTFTITSNQPLTLRFIFYHNIKNKVKTFKTC